jgi:hypothetical protein
VEQSPFRWSPVVCSFERRFPQLPCKQSDFIQRNTHITNNDFYIAHLPAESWSFRPGIAFIAHIDPPVMSAADVPMQSPSAPPAEPSGDTEPKYGGFSRFEIELEVLSAHTHTLGPLQLLLY